MQKVSDAPRPSTSKFLGEHITAPTKPYGDEPDDRVTFNLPDQKLGNFGDLGRVAMYVDELLLRTVQKIAHHELPYSGGWSWRANHEFESSPDDLLMRSFSWVPTSVGATTDGSMEPSIMVFVQAPWVLSARDFKLMYSTREVCPLWHREQIIDSLSDAEQS